MNDDDRIAFVDAVRLQGIGVPAPTGSARSPFGLTASELEAVASEEARSAVVGGGALSFAAGVRGQARQDVLDGTLLAQLSANAEHDPVEAPVAWYRRYTQVLEHLGWTLEGRTFTEREGSGTTVQLSREALELLRAVVSGPDLAVLRGALDALGTLPDDARALSIFDGNAAAGSGGIFQLGAARQEQDGLVALGLGTFHYRTEERRAKFLFFAWGDHEVALAFALERATLNPAAHAAVRSEVDRKLTRRRLEFLEDLEL